MAKAKVKRVQITVSISKDAYDALRTIARFYRCSLDEAVEMAIGDFIAKHLGIEIIPAPGLVRDFIDYASRVVDGDYSRDLD